MPKNVTLDWKKFAIVPLSAALIVAGCSDGGSNKTVVAEPETVQPAGKVVQGPVDGATVCADIVVANNKCDAGEPSTTTDSNGNFTFASFTHPGAVFNLVTEGGYDTVGKRPAYPMLAKVSADPKEVAAKSTVVNPIGTMGVLGGAEAEAALKESLGVDSLDIDLSDPEGISPEAMKTAKSLETTLRVFAELGQDNPTAQRNIMKKVAQKIVEEKADPLKNLDDVLGDACKKAAEDFVNNPADLAEGDDNAGAVDFELNSDNATSEDFGNLIKSAVSTVTTEVDVNTTDGKVIETTFQEELESEFSGFDFSGLQDFVKTVSMGVSGMRMLDGSSNVLASTTEDDLDSPVTVGSAIELCEADLEYRNDFGLEKFYSNVSVTLKVDDNNSSRQAVFTLSNLDITVPLAGEGTLGVDDSDAELLVKGTTAGGDKVSNEGSPFMGPFETIGFFGNTMSFDLATIQQLLVDNDLTAFEGLSKKGSYTVSIIVDGAPVADQVLQVTVE